MTREGSGGVEVPVAMRDNSGGVAGGLEEVVARLKKRVGTEPQVRGAMKVAMAVWPGWR